MVCRLHDPEAACFLICCLPFCKNVKYCGGGWAPEGIGQWVLSQQLMSLGERRAAKERLRNGPREFNVACAFRAPSRVDPVMETWGG